MASWFKTRKEANVEMNKREHNIKPDDCIGGNEVWRWTFTKRKKPFFVGTRLQWLNIG